MNRYRTYLFVPADRPDRIPKALASGADSVVLDLEDAVQVARKEVARAIAVEAVRDAEQRNCGLGVRINAMNTPFAEADLAALAPVLPHLNFLILPMVSTAQNIRDCRSFLEAAFSEVPLIPLIETARGVLNAYEIASETQVFTLAFGPADLSRELGVEPSAEGEELFTARSQIVLACAAAEIRAPIDGPYLNLNDDEGMRIAARKAKELGFGGKQVIHPRQIPPVAETFAPTTQELEWARKVDVVFREAEARGVSSIRLADGTFVDYPIAQRARRILEEYQSH
ncbi:HpcH/HpaI aldolase/citrate lyase family protein [Nesterenkonia ebinurensis]|uniref:HpcH/HpaI aldolase/citrate lyase family protein n=1 Tax=Nesterenkonia ebinurensis TaxID=2608252 RepID=UPI00123DEE68|nr:CoA ester lyase [Nesterenkonia ebinurensis]